MDDQKIVDLYWERSEEAIAQTQKKYGKYCYHIAYTILYSNEDAEECVNDTYLRAWGAMPPAKPNRLSTFLGKITRNLALDRWEKNHAQKRGGAIELALDELSECLPDPEASPAEAVSSGELRQALNSFVAGLEETDRKLFVGRYFHSYSPRELADAYGMKENALNQRLYRIRERLRKHLSERGYTV